LKGGRGRGCNDSLSFLITDAARSRWTKEEKEMKETFVALVIDVFGSRTTTRGSAGLEKDEEKEEGFGGRRQQRSRTILGLYFSFSLIKSVK